MSEMDEVWKWWTDRSGSTLGNIKIDSDCISFTARAKYRKGMVVKLSVSRDILTITCDGKPAVSKKKKEFGARWIYIIVPVGEHDVQITMA